jgi:branched-chain amino acid transport system substrate-binding protein
MPRTTSVGMQRLALVIAILGWIASACVAPAPAAPATTPIKIGVLDDTTGVTTIEGALMRISTDLVVQQTNASGGINGRPIQPVYVDPKDDPTQALQLAAQLVDQDQVDVLAGAVTIPECQAVQSYAAKVHIVYVPLDGCGGDDLTARTCDRYTFRLYNGGTAQLDALVSTAVPKYGKRWGIIYADYAVGQFAYTQSKAALQRLGADYVIAIAVPFGEPNVTPYVTRIPTDGSIDLLVVTETGTDLARVMSVVQQFGINQHVPIFGGGNKEFFGGNYPEALNGALAFGGRYPAGDPTSNPNDFAFEQAWEAMAHQDAAAAAPLGGPEKASPGNGNGYNAYLSMNALKLAMRASQFANRADTEKLIGAFENLQMPQGPEFPGGAIVMNKANHQGQMTFYLLKIDGQQEDLVQTFPAESLPTIGDCTVSRT